ncbi:MAG: hypothetical protein ACOCV1_01450 [Bacillota bacterium]
MNKIFIIANIFTWLKFNFWWLLILLVLIIVFIAIIRLLRFESKTSKLPIEDDKIDEFIKYYGGVENIIKAELDGSRLKIKLKDIEKVNIDKFKDLGATGIFISDNNIKMVLPYEMKKLISKINNDL